MSKLSLQIKNVSFTYQNENHNSSMTIIEGLSFNVRAGEFVSIIGPSGSGKSTIFKLITGLEQPSSGDILINGHSYPNRLGYVGYMPQQDLLMPWRTVIENAILPLEIQELSKKQAQEQALELLEQFGLEDAANLYPSELSGGMKQRVSFLRSVLSGSNILLLDEPFSSLDSITRLSMQEWLLAQWKRFNLSIVFITHDVDEAIFLSDRVFIFTEKPVQRFEEIVIPLARPREHRDIYNPIIIGIKEQLIEQLRPRRTI